MKLQKSTRYALYAAVEMARAKEGQQVTVAEVADRYGVPVAVLAKVFQQLVRARVAVGTRGSGGGYQLACRASRITLLDVIEAFEIATLSGGGPHAGGCHADAAGELRRVLDELDVLVRSTLASVNLATLVGRRGPGAFVSGARS